MTKQSMKDIGPDAHAVEVIGSAAPAFTLAFLRACPDAVAILNSKGRVGFLNQTGRTLMDLDTSETVTGRRWWDLWPEDERAGLQAAFDRALSGQLVKLGAARTSSGGERRRWDLTLSPIINLDGQTESVLLVARAPGV
ncbi:PAS domain-containing protein [Aestuariibius insulae]|uniref:PAS domain-containing protein n=1 Tax=Aestuariibius insulae TaxID=2058287 RepID=UPI00345E4B30